MNIKNFLKSLLTLVLFMSATAFAQPFATVYVDVSNGSDGYTGEFATNSPPGRGPKATIGGGLSSLANNGTLVIFAGDYNGVDNAGGAVNIATGTYAALTTGLTIELRPLPPLNPTDINLTAGAFIVNLTGTAAVLNITNTGGARLNQTNTTVTLTAGNINLNAAATWVLASTTTINIAGTAAFTNAAPTRTTNVSLSYTGGGSFSAGPESNYGTYGTGTIAIGKTPGTTVTFPNSITFAAANIGDVINVATGNATFSGTVNLGLGDVVNSGAATVTFNGAVILGVAAGAGVADADLSSYQNTAGGSIVVNAASTWGPPSATFGGAKTYPAAAATYLATNSGTGSLTLGAISLVAINTAGSGNYTVTINNAAAPAALSLGTVTAASSGTNAFFGVLNLVNAGTGTIAGGTYRGTMTNTGTLTVNGTTSLTLALTNSGTIALGASTFNLVDAGVAQITVGGTITTSTGKLVANNAAGTTTFNGGTFGTVEINSTGTAVNFIAAFTITTLDLTAGTVGLNAAGTTTNMNVTGATVTVAATIVQTVTNYSQTGGSFTLAAGATTTLDIKGNFNRTTGTFANGGAVNTRVSFTGSGAQSVNGGTLFMVENLTFTNAGGLITVNNAIRATGTVTISTATNVDFGTTNLILNGAANGMINNGTYTATGGGGVILGGTTTVVGGVTGNGFSLQGTGTYSYVTVDVGGALAAAFATISNTVASPTVITTAAHGLATGDVILYAGSASIPAGYYAVTVILATTFSIPVAAAANDGAQSFQQMNAAEVTTTLTGVKWNGVLTLRSGALSVATAGLDFGPTGSVASIVRTPQGTSGIQAITGATFNTANVSYDLTYTGALTANQPVGGELTASPANVRTWTISTTGAFNNDLPATTSVNFGGTLTVSAGAFLRIPTNAAAVTFTLSGASRTHTVAGSLVNPDATDFFIFSGASTTVNGSTVITDAATIGNVQFNGTGQTVTNVFIFSGTVTTGAASTVTFGMGSAAARQVITGLLTLGGTTFTLTTNVNPRAGITHSAGVFDFGANTVNLTVGGAFLQTAGSYASTGGYLQFSIAGSLTLTSAMPYLRANNVAITLGAAATVSQNLDIAGAAPGTITNAGFNLTIQNTMTTVGGAVFTGTGNLILSSTITASGDPTISNMTVNSTGTATLASSVAATARTFTITGVVTHTAGELALGINHVSITGTAGNVYARAAGTITASTGELRFEGGGVAQAVSEGTTFSVPNLTINNVGVAVTFAGTGTAGFTVTGTLRLTAGTLSSTTAGRLHIGNLATIERFSTASSLTQLPTFDGDVNLSYRGGSPGTMANEMPTAASNRLNNLLINLAAAPNTIATALAGSWKGTMTLTQGTFNSAVAFTGASGSTIVMNGGVLGFAPTVTTYNLTYTTVSVTTTNNEFQVGAGITVNLTVNPGVANTVTLNVAKTVNNLTITTGTLANGGFNLTVLGNFNGVGGAFTGTGALIFNGTAAQAITVPAGGYALGGNLTINNAAGVSLAGGNLTIGAGNIVTFTSGVLTTSGTTVLVLAQTVASPGYARTSGHVNGSVRHAITTGAGVAGTWANGRYEFPVGTTTDYRPFAITFTSTYPALSPTSVTVSHVNSSPQGIKDLPLDAGSGLKIGNYAAYYWLVSTTPSPFTATQLFDLDATGTNIGIPYTSDQLLRIIRRQDGNSLTNGWSLQGVNYSNYQTVVGSDTTAVVRTTASIGGIINEGTRFAIGVPTRAPLFTAPTTLSYTMNEAATLNVTFTADPQDVGETVSYSLVSPPAFATINATTGVLALAPGYADGRTAPYTITVRATDAPGGMTADRSISVTVVNVNRAPVFTTQLTTRSMKNDSTLTFTYVATDADGEALTYTLVPITPTYAGTATVGASTGILTFSPVFADAGKVFAVQVNVSDGIATVASTVASVTVTYARLKGDVNGDGLVNEGDATKVLRHVVGLITIAAGEATWAALVGPGGTDDILPIKAISASRILFKAASPTGAWPTWKVGAVSGSIAFGDLRSEPNSDVITVPLKISNGANILAASFTLDIDKSLASLESIASNLPDGWQFAHNFTEDGKLNIALAGTQPLPDGNFANITLKLANKESKLMVSGNGSLNDELAVSLQPLNVRQIPAQFELSQNYPNPFNPTTTIKYQLASNTNMSLVIYDMLGRKVRTLINDVQEAGYYSVTWNGMSDNGVSVSSGLYIYRIEAGSYIATKKMSFMK